MPKKNQASIDLSLLMISRNTKTITLEALRSIYRHTQGINFEIILVDHNSNDGSRQALAKFARSKKNLIFIDTQKNPGFGAGNNLAAKNAKGKYLLFVNTDVVFKTNLLKGALAWMRTHPKVAVYSCRLLNADGSLQASGGFFPTLAKIFAWQLFIDDLPVIKKLIRSIHPHQWFYKKSRYLDWVSGAFMLIPNKLFKKLKGFDENIWMYVEELELCFRVKQLGYLVAYQTSPSLIHLGGSSSGSHRLGITQEIKNFIYFYRKHKPAWQLPLVKLLFLTGSALRFIIFGIIKHNETAKKAYIEGIKLAL